ncbi:MAG: AmmeMemoRadiSam system protein B [Candidatus Geothermarchaeota archaeon]
MKKAVDRKPYVAGIFYPSDRAALVNEIESLFRSKLGPGEIPSISVEGPRNILGLISPHAGYTYSGAIAAHGYYHLALDGLPETIILIGPNHTGLGSAISVYPSGKWYTPLGEVYVNEELVDMIVEASPLLDADTLAHKYEHSIEVQIPFLQYIYGKVNKTFKIIPIVMMYQSWAGVEALGEALVKVLKGLNKAEYLLVASTDYSHYVPAYVAKKKDSLTFPLIEELNASRLIETVYSEDISMCGYGPVATLLYVASKLGACKGILLKYANSGDVTGDYTSVVGYASFKIIWQC